MKAWRVILIIVIAAWIICGIYALWSGGFKTEIKDVVDNTIKTGNTQTKDSIPY